MIRCWTGLQITKIQSINRNNKQSYRKESLYKSVQTFFSIRITYNIRQFSRIFETTLHFPILKLII